MEKAERREFRMNFKMALIDMDIIVYRCGYAVQEYDKESDTLYIEPWEHCKYNINSMINRIRQAIKPDGYQGYLTSNDRSNFRFQMFPDYKKQRKDVPKPYYYDQIRDYLIEEYKAQVVSGEEADDRISIVHCELNRTGCHNYNNGYVWTEANNNSIIVSIDKDFNNVPGWHYNFVMEDLYFLSELDALRNFYLQILTGDTADGIPRIKKGWREKKVKASLIKATTEKEMLKIVRTEIYNVLFKKNIERLIINNTGFSYMEEEIDLVLEQKARLVHLRRAEGEIWQIPT